MSLYEFLLFVHVLAAAAWFGAALLALVLMELAARATDTSFVVRFVDYDDKLAPLLFIPAALLTLIAGIALVLDGPWSFTEDGWVTAGLVLFVAIFAFGIAMILPASKKLAALAEANAPTAELEAQIGKLRMLSWIDVGVLAIAIFLMTTKPF